MNELVASLGDHVVAYVPGIGEVTVGEIRAGRGTIGGVDDADRRFWERLVTRNLEWKQCPDGGIRQARRASTASRCLSGPTPPTSS